MKNNFEKIEFATNELKKITRVLKDSGGVICKVESIDPDGRYGLTVSITIGFRDPPIRSKNERKETRMRLLANGY